MKRRPGVGLNKVKIPIVLWPFAAVAILAFALFMLCKGIVLIIREWRKGHKPTPRRSSGKMPRKVADLDPDDILYQHYLRTQGERKALAKKVTHKVGGRTVYGFWADEEDKPELPPPPPVPVGADAHKGWEPF